MESYFYEEFYDEDYLEIEHFVNNAIYAPTKATGSSFVQKLDNLLRNNYYSGDVNVILGQLVAYVHSAARQGENKEFYISIVETELYKLHGKIKKTEE